MGLFPAKTICCMYNYLSDPKLFLSLFKLKRIKLINVFIKRVILQKNDSNISREQCYQPNSKNCSDSIEFEAYDNGRPREMMRCIVANDSLNGEKLQMIRVLSQLTINIKIQYTLITSISVEVESLS